MVRSTSATAWSLRSGWSVATRRSATPPDEFGMSAGVTSAPAALVHAWLQASATAADGSGAAVVVVESDVVVEDVDWSVGEETGSSPLQAATNARATRRGPTSWRNRHERLDGSTTRTSRFASLGMLHVWVERTLAVGCARRSVPTRYAAMVPHLMDLSRKSSWVRPPVLQSGLPEQVAQVLQIGWNRAFGMWPLPVPARHWQTDGQRRRRANQPQPTEDGPWPQPIRCPTS